MIPFIQSTRNWIILAVLAIIWGSSFLLIKKGLIAFSPVQVACLRISLSCIAFLPFLHKRLLRVKAKQLLPIFGVALFGSGIPPFLFAYAQTHIDSGITGIINSLVPLWTLILGVLLFRVPFKWLKLAGVLIGLTGAALLIFFKHDGTFEGDFRYGIYVVMATICYGTSVNLLKFYLQEVDALVITLLAFMMIGPPSLAGLLFTDFFHQMAHHPFAWQSFGATLLLAFFGTAFALVLFNTLVQKTSALYGSTVTYLLPIVAVTLGTWDGETFGWMQFVGMGLILGGVYLINRPIGK